jgi:hypothetical protein
VYATGAPGAYRFDVSVVADVWTGVDVTGHVVAPDYAGPGATSAGAIVGALDARFDDFLARTPEGTRPFNWYAYRDPLLPGTPDIQGARALVRKMKPAHTHAAAITRLAVLCDSSETSCDREPLGGI